MYSPTEKQINAILNMKKVLNDESSIPYFDNSQEFQEYFSYKQNEVKKKIKSIKKKIAFNNLSNEKKDEILQKRQTNIENYYKNPTNLYNTWLKYYNTYKPSLKSLKEYLWRKCNDENIVNQVISKFTLIIDEEYDIEKKISNLYKQGKTSSYISSYLYSKWYNSTKIKELMWKYKEENHFDEESLPPSLYNKIKNKYLSLKRRWKDDFYIKFTLSSYLIDYKNKDLILTNIIKDLW